MSEYEKLAEELSLKLYGGPCKNAPAIALIAAALERQYNAGFNDGLDEAANRVEEYEGAGGAVSNRIRALKKEPHE